MFKLDKSERERLSQSIDALRKYEAKIVSAIEAHNSVVEAARLTIDEAIAEYNEELEDVRGFVDDIANERSDEWDSKSEKWQEGERGEAARDWIEAYEEIDLRDIGISWPDDLSLDDILGDDNPADILNGLPSEPSE